MKKKSKMTSGIKALAEDLRFRGELPPSPRELLKELRKQGELPQSPSSIVRLKEPDDPVAIPAVAKAEAPITVAEYSGLQQAFGFLNAKLFDGALPNVVILLQRRAHSGGHFSPDRFTSRAGGAGASSGYHEVSLNPDGFVGQSDQFIISILLHEMTHEWQHYFGKQKRKSYGYHDKEWASKMESLGLMPSNSGMVGGKRTGSQMQHYVLPGGAYEQAFAELAATGWELGLESTIYPGGEKKKDESHTKFTCPGCGWIARAKPDSELIHKPCGLDMLAERPAAAQSQSYDQAAE